MIYRRALLFVQSIDLSPALWYNNSKSYCYSSVRIDEVYGFQFGVLPDQLSAMHQLQQELLDRTESRQNYDDLVEEILLLREQQEQNTMNEAAKAEHRDRIQALCNFINSQPHTITKFDGTLVRKLLKDVKVCDVFIEFRFKSGTSVIIEK